MASATNTADVAIPAASAEPRRAVAVRQFTRYFLGSAAALAVDSAMFSVGIRLLDWTWPVAATAGFLAGTALLYLYSIRYVFGFRAMRENAAAEFAHFAAAGLLGLGLTQALLYVGIEMLGAAPELVRVGAAGVTFLFNYTVRTLVLFRKPRVA